MTPRASRSSVLPRPTPASPTIPRHAPSRARWTWTRWSSRPPGTTAPGPGFGSISGPGGAPAALTVGAADMRAHTQEVHVSLRSGLKLVLDRSLPLTGEFAPPGAFTSEIAAPGLVRTRASFSLLESYFTSSGLGLVAGRAALVPAGDSPAATARSAARAGATAVVLYGARLPVGGVPLDEDTPVPVVSIPAADAAKLLAAIAGGHDAGISIGTAHDADNDAAGTVAAFSSTGLAYDGRVKPDVVAPGVSIATAEPRVTNGGSTRYGTVNGSSAAAAAVAGAAAVLAQARPSLGAPVREACSSGTARPLSASRSRAKARDSCPSAALLRPSSQRSRRPWRSGTRARRLEALAERRRSQRLDASGASTGALCALRTRCGGCGVPSGSGAFHDPGRRDAERAARRDREDGSDRHCACRGKRRRHRGRRLAAPSAVGGDVRRAAGHAARPAPPLDRIRSQPSDAAPALLTFQAGRILGDSGRDEVQPVALLQPRAPCAAKGTVLGTLATLRDLLPGRYAFGLTGRTPAGNTLGKGRYRIRVTAVPSLAGPSSTAEVAFTIK